MLEAGVEVDVGVRGGLASRKIRIIQRLGDRDIDPVKRVNHLSKGLEVDCNPIVHGLASDLGYGRRRQVAAARRTSPASPNVWKTLAVHADGVGQVDAGGDRPVGGQGRNRS